MARLTVFTSFFVSVFKASKTLKLMIVTHFQRFFRWPGAPKMDPKRRPNFIFFVSFFVLGPRWVHGAPRRCPRGPKRGPGGPKRNPREAKGDPKGVQGNPKGVQGEPRRTQKGSRGSVGKARWREGRRQLDPPRHAMVLGVLKHLQHPPESDSEENPSPSLAIV